MNHYENILDNQSYNGNKYAPNEATNNFMNTDAFFSSIFKNVTLNKPVETKGEEDSKESNNDADKEDPSDDADKENPSDEIKLPSETEPTSERGKIVHKYIKKCYKIIVLKCHPDKIKNETLFDKTKIFIKCKDYYDNQLLIGLLYIFYIYNITPPAPLITSMAVSQDDEYNMLMDQIIHEIRVIQEKLVEFKLPINEETDKEKPDQQE
jgi:hypothetical protein